jgi:hypothetical protein
MSRCDNGGEYTSNALKIFVQKKESNSSRLYPIQHKRMVLQKEGIGLLLKLHDACLRVVGFLMSFGLKQF